MKNIWKIFRRDVLDATNNVIAVIVLIGLIIVPALYAWFNIAASWDPYSNAKSIKVAVVNMDTGYKSDLIPVKINVGETVANTLKANDQLDWNFVDRESALDGVRSGQYYAAIVIPKDFSADMMTLFSSDIKHAQLGYYLNQKKNAIAPTVTEKGADTVASTIDTTFVKTVGQVGIDLASQVFAYSQSPQAQQYLDTATSHLNEMASRLDTASAQVVAYGGLLDSSAQLVDSTGKIIGQSGSSITQARKALGQGVKGTKSVGKALSGAADSVNTALDQTGSAYDAIAKQVDDAFRNVGLQSDAVANQLQTLSDQVSNTTAGYDKVIQNLQAVRESVEANDILTPDAKQKLLSSLDNAIANVRSAQDAQKDLSDRLGAASQSVKDNSGSLRSSHQDLQKSIAQARKSVDKVSKDYQDTLRPQLQALADSVDTVVSQTGGLLDDLDDNNQGISSLSSSVSSDLKGAQDHLHHVADKLSQASGKLTALSGHLADTMQSDKGQEATDARKLLSGDAETLASLLTSPVAVQRKAVFPIANYGSSMAPFYSTLSIWVGATILAAMMTVSISDRKKARVLGLDSLKASWLRADALDEEGKQPWGPFRPESPGNARRFGMKLYQEYFGRFLVFAVMAILQGCMVCLGDLFYLKIQCEHPLLFLLVGILAAFVFMNLIYTLVVSFGDVGKALAVILLVMQVAGSGGTVPREVLPDFFQAVYPFLPFVHAIAAMQSAIAGVYGMEFWREIGAICLFLVPSLLLGLVLRNPVIRLNSWFMRNMESTKLM